jgi:hypothetical protein
MPIDSHLPQADLFSLVSTFKTSLFPPKESLVVTSWLGTGKSRTFFLQCTNNLHAELKCILYIFFWRKNKVDLNFLCVKHFYSTLVNSNTFSPSGIAGFKGKIASEKKMLEQLFLRLWILILVLNSPRKNWNGWWVRIYDRCHFSTSGRLFVMDESFKKIRTSELMHKLDETYLLHNIWCRIAKSEEHNSSRGSVRLIWRHKLCWTSWWALWDIRWICNVFLESDKVVLWGGGGVRTVRWLY